MPDDARAVPRRRVILLVALGAVLGAGAVVVLTWSVTATSGNAFCATACHSMQWAAAAYERGPHFANALGVRASCADCHIAGEDRPSTPLEYVTGTLRTKGVAGIADMFHKLVGSIADRAKWEAQRAQLSTGVRAWIRETDSVTCQGCHDLAAFSARGSAMAVAVHAGVLKTANVDCTSCHAKNVGHVYDEDLAAYQAARKGGSSAGGTPESLLQKYGCDGCHAEDETLVGPSYRQIAGRYAKVDGAAKRLEAAIHDGVANVWGTVPMPAQPEVPAADAAAIVGWILAR